ncbi:MAG: proline--tRNA ligase, partial [Clostridia bacterium]|nr:proline--tRNA ligase [Clostridia bacterium]
YKKIVNQYIKIFKELGLDVFPVNADNGSMGGSGSQEIMAVSVEGDNDVCKCSKCGYAGNVEIFPCEDRGGEISTEQGKYEKVLTLNTKTIEDLVSFFNASNKDFAKSIVYKTENGLVVAVVRGDRNVNEIKLRNFLKVKDIELATYEEIETLGSVLGFVGAVGLKQGTKIVVDNEVKYMKNFIVGANEKDYHLSNVNIKDFDACEFADIRFATEEDIHSCGGKLEIVKATELGHCFKLGKRYTEKLNTTFVDNNNKPQVMTMGCYGIGLERAVVAIVDKYHDEKGLTLPVHLAPFKVDLIYNDKYADIAENVYSELMSNDIETLIDDRKNVTFGVKFKDAELLGIPYKVIIGKNYENNGQVEVESRVGGEKFAVKLEELVSTIKNLVK